MKRRTLSRLMILVVAAAFAPVLARASDSIEVAGVRYAISRNAEPEGVPLLRLHGVGLLRYKGLIKAYVAALYLEDGAGAESALDAGTARRLELEYFHAIPASGFASATKEGIALNSTPAERAEFGAATGRFCSLYRDVKPGDRYSITFVPGRGTQLSLNGEILGTIEGNAFARALFSIWLGDGAFDRSLRARLLERVAS